MRRLFNDPRLKAVVAFLVGLVLVIAAILQRQTIIDALGEIGRLPTSTVAVLLVLAVIERVSRAEVIRSLLPQLTLTRSEMISDVGSAASKGLPVGGPIATVLRWQLARDRLVGGSSFIIMLVASGVATAFVSWGYPLIATLIDVAGRDADIADLVIIVVCSVVLGGSAVFWLVALRSERAHRYVIGRSEWVLRRWPLDIASDEAGASPNQIAVRTVEEIRDGLRSVGRRPFGLLLRTLVAQGTGAVILWVTLHGLGVGDELALTEFARVFFVAHILGSLAPTPGGVGVIEAGLTGALVAAGVGTEVALAGVLVYRFITYVLPMLIGATWYVLWRCRPAVANGASESALSVSVRSSSDAVH